MDRPGLSHHVAFHVHEDDNDRLKSLSHLKPSPVTLRSISKSDPHLSIPHLLVSQDEDHPSLNRIVSGLFHVDSALRTPHASCGNLEHSGSDSSGEDSVISSKSSSAISQAASLRKSSSATDWSAAMAEVSRKNSKSCVVMNNSTDHNQNSSAVTAQIRNDGRCTQDIAASAGSSSQPPSTNSAEVNDSGRQQSHGLFGGVFQRGFFSKPAMRSEEEGYRYIMALDR